MSRYDYRDAGTDPAYCDRLGGHPGIERHCFRCGESVWVSRDDEYQVQEFCDRCRELPIDPPVDPAEHAAHAIIDALTTLEQQIVLATTLERLDVLRKIAKRAEQHATLVNGKCAAAIDTLLERRR